MNLDDGEAVVLIVSIAVTLVAGSGYYLRLQRVARFSCPPGQRVPLYLAPPLSLGLLGVVLLRCAAGDVRGGGIYFALFMALGGAWIFATLALCGCLGVDFRSDALENHNSAVIIALSGVIIGVTLAYAGGNIGEGDSIWQTIFSSALATLGWLLSWCLLDGLTHTSIAVAESRDKASAWRLAGFLVASGLILGRAAAGDWQSVSNTLLDFAKYGWPELIMLGIATPLERALQPAVKNPSPKIETYGILPAGSYLLFALATLFLEGRWK